MQCCALSGAKGVNYTNGRIKYGVRLTNKFKKDFKAMQKRKVFDNKAFEFVIDTLRKGEILPKKHRNHLLEPKSERSLGMSYIFHVYSRVHTNNY